MTAFAQGLALIALAPLLQGAMRWLRARMQGRPGPPPVQPYSDLGRRIRQEALRRPGASWIADAAPGIALGASIAFAFAVPFVAAGAFGGIVDVVALVFLLALGRFATALSALDAGTGFTGMAASREMTFASLAEPLLLLSLLAGMPPAASSLSALGTDRFDVGSALALAAFVVVVLAETARVPVDNQETHYELTMIHEGMLLQYGGWQLALWQAAAYVKQIAFIALAAAMLPGGWAVHVIGIGAVAIAITVIETLFAKLRLFRVPDLIAAGSLLAAASLLARFAAGPLG